MTSDGALFPSVLNVGDVGLDVRQAEEPQAATGPDGHWESSFERETADAVSGQAEQPCDVRRFQQIIIGGHGTKVSYRRVRNRDLAPRLRWRQVRIDARENAPRGRSQRGLEARDGALTEPSAGCGERKRWVSAPVADEVTERVSKPVQYRGLLG